MMEEMDIALDDIYALLKYVDVFAPCRKRFCNDEGRKS